MKTPATFAPEQVEYIIRRTNQGAAPCAIAGELGCTTKSVRQKIHWLRRRGKLPPAGTRKRRTDRADVSWSERGDSAEVEGVGRIRTLEHLLTAAKVDRTLWEVERWQLNKYEQASKDAEGSPVVTELFQVKAWLRRNHQAADLTALRQALVSDIRAESRRCPRPEGPAIIANRGDLDRYLFELSIFDHHVGNLAWAQETGEAYDTDIAERLYQDAVRDLLRLGAPFTPERILYPIGQDFFHIDTKTNTTTAGTPQDVDGRWQRSFRRGRRIVSETIRRLREIAPVEVVVVPGNHDEQRAWYLGEVLAAEWDGDRHVRVRNDPALRKYVQYGACAIGYTHGAHERPQDLPLIMAQEEPAMWAATRHREWHTGHLHKSKETRFTAGDTYQGVVVRIIPSLCGTDAWHYAKGYVRGLRAAQAFVWHRDAGLVALLSAHASE